MFPDAKTISEIDNLKFWYYLEETLPEEVHRVFCESWKIYLTTNKFFFIIIPFLCTYEKILLINSTLP